MPHRTSVDAFEVFDSLWDMAIEASSDLVRESKYLVADLVEEAVTAAETVAFEIDEKLERLHALKDRARELIAEADELARAARWELDDA